MSKVRKTREEKIQSGYRLQNFRLAEEARREVKDASEFGYLSSEYVLKDLRKTIIFSLLIMGILVMAKRYLG
ncbi:MAG: hypothetical protein UX62_C0046G0015 [Microgenomates group bacterium GW2011_GWA2_46_7]|nr:MAG: hypothetical protein UX62_C0046G0015 [Microgenomates group bacterium GW2011_GWA2_46_7]KKU46598.1 MAG: hypothetical protein UX64_C0005G0015 [Microgenomates group bacterium GW2011_GWC2_46_7]